MKKIVDNLLKNRDIEANLKSYSLEFMKLNYEYAYIRLAMNYYTYYMILSDMDDTMLLQDKEIAEVNKVLEELFTTNEPELQECQKRIEELRQKMISLVGDLTCYVDRFNIYEYALNRVEYRFKNQEIPTDYSDENMTRKLMQYILDDEDRGVINQKISMVIGQLPLRLTKNKFYEMVAQGLSIYKEGSVSTLNDFLYMIKTTGMLETSTTMQENYPHLEETLDGFKKVSFKQITKDEYDEMHDCIEKSSEYMEELMSGYLIVQEIINDVLLLLYTWSVAENQKTEKLCKEIVENTNLLFMNKFSPKSVEEVEEMFIALEGRQEELYEKLTAYDITDYISKNYTEAIEKLELDAEYEIVYKLAKLNSDSIFIDMEKDIDDSPVSEEYLAKVQKQLLEEYSVLFENSETIIRRAVMALTISEFPIFFNNISELQDYIYNNLSMCIDKAEKLACIEILNGIMEA